MARDRDRKQSIDDIRENTYKSTRTIKGARTHNNRLTKIKTILKYVGVAAAIIVVLKGAQAWTINKNNEDIEKHLLANQEIRHEALLKASTIPKEDFKFADQCLDYGDTELANRIKGVDNSRFTNIENAGETLEESIINDYEKTLSAESFTATEEHLYELNPDKFIDREEIVKSVNSSTEKKASSMIRNSVESSLYVDIDK